MPKRWIDICYAVVFLPTMATSMLPVCQTLMSLMLIDGLTLLYKIQPFHTSRQT